MNDKDLVELLQSDYAEDFADQAASRIIELIKALEFYANIDTYEKNAEPPYQEGFTPIEVDEGAIARRTLNQM